MSTKSDSPDIQTWPDERLTEDVNDSGDLWVAEAVERMRRARAKEEERKRAEEARKREEACRKAEEEQRKAKEAEEARKAEEERRRKEEAAAKKREMVERASDKCKGIACNRCAQQCVLGTGKSTSCTSCRETKVKCEWAGEEPKPERRRKRRAEEEPEDPKKKARLVEAEEKGSDEPAWLEALWAISEAISGLRTTTEVQNQRVAHQNKLLEKLVLFKSQEVWGSVGEVPFPKVEDMEEQI